MPSIKSLTIHDIMQKINHSFFLPDIQRDFKWDEERVVNLFDSLLNDYPLGTCLIWKHKISDYNDSGYAFYKFINRVHSTDNSGEKLEKPVSAQTAHIYAVLDGQQRLTSIFVALNGGYEVWKGRGRHPRTNPPLRELYFSPAGRSGKDFTTQNQFEFLNATSDKAKIQNEEWYRVKDIYRLRQKDLDAFFERMQITKKPQKTQIKKLYERLHVTEALSFYEIPKSYTAEDAVNIFLRLNSGGMPLKRTELLFALAINNWQGGREEIEAFLKDVHSNPGVYGQWNSIDKDFVLKTCLYVSEQGLSMSVQELRQVDFQCISSSWEDTIESIIDVLKMLDENGHCSSTVKSSNAILPLVYYRFNHPALFKDETTQKNLNAFFILAQLNGIFSSSTDNVLVRIRDLLREKTGTAFSIFEFATLFESKKTSGRDSSLKCNHELVESWFFGESAFEKDKDAENIMLILASLPEYHNRAHYYYEVDHLHPARTFRNEEALKQMGLTDETIIAWNDLKNTIGNLQLYRDRNNQKKSGRPLSSWKNDHPSWSFAYDPIEMIKNDPSFIPGSNPYDILYFPLFVENRSKKMIAALEEILLIDKDTSN